MNPITQLNKSFESLAPSSTLYINEKVSRLWLEKRTVFHLGFGESRFDVHPKLKQALSVNADKKSYLAARGLPLLCESIASYYSAKLNLSFEPDQVLIGPGSKAIIYGLFKVLDAHIFLPTPSWVSYAPQAHLLGNQCDYIPSKADTDYQLDLKELERLVEQSSKECKVLVLNSPNNPTGQMISSSELKQIADYCRRRGIWVLSDEIYFQVSHGAVPHTSIAQYYPEGTVILGGLSKHLSIGGWRVGVGVFPNHQDAKDLLSKLIVFASESWSSVSAPIQYAATVAYSNDPEIETYIQECCELHRIRTSFIRDKLIEMGVRCTRAEGAFYICANFDAFAGALTKLGISSSPELAEYLLEKYSIATLPGSDFGIPKSSLSLRLSTSYLDMEQEGDSLRLLSLLRDGASAQEITSEKHHPNTHDALESFKSFIASLA